MSERDALERIRVELKHKIDMLIDDAIDQIESRMKMCSLTCSGFTTWKYFEKNEECHV